MAQLLLSVSYRFLVATRHLVGLGKSSWNLSLVTLAVCSVIVSSAPAQLGPYGDTNSTPIPGGGRDYVNDLNETINPENGALSVRIAAPAPKERGLTLPIYIYTYDSNGQSVLVPTWAYDGYSNKEYVTLINLQVPTNVGSPNSVTYDTNTINTYVGNRFPASCTYWSNFIYTDYGGNRHPLPGLQGTNNTQPVGCAGLGIAPSATGQPSGDGIYTGIFLGPGANAIVFNNSGDQVAATPGYVGFEDRNGNAQYSSGRPYTTTPVSQTIPSLGGPYASASVPGLGSPYTFSPTVGTRGSTSPFPFNATPSTNQDSSCPTSFVGTVGGYSGTATLSIPDNQQYSFTVDSQFGLLNHISYPVAGTTVDYTWGTIAQSQYVSFSLPSNTPSAPCFYTYDWPAVKTRVVSLNGATVQEQDFSYSTSYDNGVGTPWTQKVTTVITTDKATAGTPSFKTVYTYNASNPATSTPEVDTVDIYGTDGSLLHTVTKSYNSLTQVGAECRSSSGGAPDIGIFRTYLGSSVLTTDVSEWGDGSYLAFCQQPTGYSPARETVTSYHTFAATPISANAAVIKDRPDSVKIYGNGTLTAETDYNYDEHATAAVSATGHDDANYGSSSSAPRGNATTITRKCFIPGGPACADSITHLSYDETGQLTQILDPRGNATSFSYADNYTSDNGAPAGNTNAYMTLMTRPSSGGVSHLSGFQYGYLDGKLRSTSDENAQITTFCYKTGGCQGSTFDPWFRTTQTVTPDGGGVAVSYAHEAAGSSITTTVSSAPNPNVVSVDEYDGMGRPISSKLTSDPGGAIYTTSTYDGLGRLALVTNPSRCSAVSGCTEPTAGSTSYSRDSRGRLTQITYPDLSTKTWSYVLNLVDRYDEAGNRWRDTYDGLGRLLQVREPNPHNPDIMLLTEYAHNALDQVVSTDQLSDEGPDVVQRTSQFTYDSLGRLTAATTPEAGTKMYGYDLNGNLTSATDARGVTTNYSYDVLNRLSQKTYTIPPPVNGVAVATATPSVFYQYDTSSLPNPSNTVGRLTDEKVMNGASLVYERAIPAYDPMGRVERDSRCVSGFCPYLVGISYGYDLAGHLTMTTSGDTVLSYAFDGSGHLNSETLTDNSNATSGYVTFHITYTPLGDIASANDFETRQYDRRGRVTNIGYNSSAYGLNYAASYDYYPAGDVHHANDSVNGNWTYDYDALHRLTSATSADPTVGTQSYTYDDFGNRLSQSGVLNQSATYNTPTNRADCTGCYDAAGNLLQDLTGIAAHSYSYDAEGRLSAVNDLGYAYRYDGEGNRTVAGQNNLVTRAYYSDAYKQFTSIVDGHGNTTSAELFAGGRHVFTLADDAYLPLLDALGTEHSRRGVYAGVTENCTNLPFGDGLSCNNSDPSPLHFTGKERDAESNLDYFGARHYGSAIGRFMQPDPSGLAYADPMNPQSLNLYAYGLNNPTTNIDPDGYACVYLNNSGDGLDKDGIDGNTTSSECSQHGGYYVDGMFTHAQLYSNNDDVGLTGSVMDAKGNQNQTDAFYTDATGHLGDVVQQIAPGSTGVIELYKAYQNRLRVFVSAQNRADVVIGCTGQAGVGVARDLSGVGLLNDAVESAMSGSIKPLFNSGDRLNDAGNGVDVGEKTVGLLEKAVPFMGHFGKTLGSAGMGITVLKAGRDLYNCAR